MFNGQKYPYNNDQSDTPKEDAKYDITFDKKTEQGFVEWVLSHSETYHMLRKMRQNLV